MASLATHCGAVAPRLAGSNVARTLSVLNTRGAVVVAARAGYEARRPSRPSNSAGWDDEEEDDFAAGRPMQSGNNQAGGQQQGMGQFRPGRQYRQNQGGGQYMGEDLGEGPYSNQNAERGYNYDGQQQQQGGQGQYRQYGNQGPRQGRNYTPRGDGYEGRPPRSAGGGGYDGEQRWQGPRQMMSPEQLAQREATNQAVRQVRGWRDISMLLSDKAGQLDAENITSLFGKMVRAQRPTDEQDAAAFDAVLSSLLGWVLNLLPTYRPRHTARTLVALGRMQLYSPEVVQGLMAKASEQIGNYEDQDLTNMILAMSLLGQPPSPEFLNQFFMRTKERFSSVKLLDLSAVLQGLIKLGCHTAATPEWVQGAYAVLQAKCLELPATSEAHRALRPDGYGRYGPGSPAQEAGAPEGATTPDQQQQQRRSGNRPYQRRGPSERHPSEVSLEEYVELVMAVATLAKDTGVQPSQELVDALLTQQSWRLYSGNWAAMSRILWAATNLTARPSTDWFVNVDKALGSKDRFWELETLPGLCLYLGRYLQHIASPTLCKKLSSFVDNNRNLLGTEGMAPLLFLMGHSGFKPMDRWLDSVLIYLQSALPNCSVTSLEMLYSSLPLMGTGYRMNQVVTDIATRYNAAVAQQPQQEYAAQEGEAAAAAVV